MKYTHSYTTRWHDTDANRVLRTSRILTYMQETGNRQCTKYSLPLDALRDERGLAFILSSISIKVNRPIHEGERLEVSTWCREARGFSFLRYFDIKVGDETVAYAHSTWALVDINEKKIVRAPEDLAPHFPYDEAITDELLPRPRIQRDEILTLVGTRDIRYSDIDYNMHMNNTNYPDMLCDFLPDMKGKFVTDISLSYLKEAPLGATLSIYCRQIDENTYKFKTANADGDICLEATVKIKEVE